MDNSGFFKNLFDVTFSEFLTIKIIKVIFIIGIIFCGLGALFFLFTGDMSFILRIIVAPIAFLLYVILLRIWLELVLVIFRIADNTDKLVEKKAD
jgi:hypothetical protein